MTKSITAVDEPLYHYITQNWVREDEIMRQLREETAKLDMAAMQISADQAQFMAFLVQLTGAKNILEIGTFTGYSALAMAKAMADDGKIICCDVSEEWTGIAKSYWEKAGIAHKIDLRLAPAINTLNELLDRNKNSFDFAFIDADKESYDFYYESCLQLIKPDGVIAIDNVFWGGAVVDDTQQDADTKAIRALNKKLQADERIDLSIVPIGDGVTLARKR